MDPTGDTEGKRDYGRIGFMSHCARIFLQRSLLTTWMLAGFILMVSIAAHGQQTDVVQGATRPGIVSPSEPRDSRGEVVYEAQGATQQEVPVAGMLLNPQPLKLPPPKYSKALRKQKFEGIVKLVGVVTEQGDVIDTRVLESTNAEASEMTLRAVARYRFRPARLNNTPVASLMKVEVNYAMR